VDEAHLYLPTAPDSYKVAGMDELPPFVVSPAMLVPGPLRRNIAEELGILPAANWELG